MSLVDTGRLAIFAAKQWGQVVRDALGDRGGSSLPYEVNEVVTPEKLSLLINEHGVEPLTGPVKISALTQRDIPSISSNCNNVVIDIEQAGDEVLPSSLFIKLPLASLATRWFFSVIGSWKLESHFFRDVAQSVPLRTPITYATHSEGSRFFLIQENLHEDPTVELFTNPDMLAGPSLELTRRCLDTFARLHAAHYDLSADEQQAILPLDLHPFLSPQMRLVSKTLNNLALKPCMRKLPGRIPPAVVDAYKLTGQHWEALLEYWFSGPLSLLHGDSHLGNFFVSGEEMGMLDWQAVHWGKGIRDVQYFLIDSLPADTLAENERQLVDYYAQRRALHGTAVDGEQLWQEYRSLSYHTLMTIVVSIGFGALNEEQDILMEEVLRRAVAAVERVDYAGWLKDFLQD
ncbi:MAG: phosphotransferase [Halioglobus sp.]